MGMWQDDVRQGSGIVVILDGMYFEGNFINDKLTVSRIERNEIYNNYLYIIFYDCVSCAIDFGCFFDRGLV